MQRQHYYFNYNYFIYIVLHIVHYKDALLPKTGDNDHLAHGVNSCLVHTCIMFACLHIHAFRAHVNYLFEMV